MTNSEIEKRANAMLMKYVQRGGVHKVWDKIMTGEAIKYRQIATSSDFVGALTRGNNGQSYIMTNAAISNDGRRNFTIAHELGHYALEHHLHSGRERKRGQRKTAAEAMKPQQPGMIRFFSNKEAKIADIILAAGLLGTAIAIAVTNGVGYSCYVFIGISVFSFCMHCILNGRMYLYVKAIMTQKYNSK